MTKTIFTILLFAAIQQTFAQTISDCATCNRVVLSESQLKGKSLEELALLRNEILARKGYVFSSGKYSGYFEHQDWYKPVQSNSEIKLSDTETKNISLLKNLEAQEKTKRDKAISDLKELKNALNADNKTVIKKYLSKMSKEEYYGVLINKLKEILNKIDLDDINFNKKSGLYKVSIDNGFSISSYEIRFDYETVRIEGGMNSHSEIFGDFDDGYSDYMSEDEFLFWYIFKVTETGIIFDHWDVAG
jgi:hypothetical protein